MQTTRAEFQCDTDAAIKRVIIIGASARAAADSAKRAGLQVVAIDQFGDQDVRSPIAPWFPGENTQQIASAIRQLTATAPGKRSAIVYTGGCERWGGDLDRLASQSGQTGIRWLVPSAALLTAVADPENLLRIAQRSGVEFPRFRWLDDERGGGVGNMGAVEDPPLFQPLFKPLLRCGGMDVQRWPAAVGPHLTQGYLQEFVAGQLWGLSFCAYADCVALLGVCRGLTAGKRQGSFVYRGSVGPIPVRPEMRRQLLQVGKAVVDAWPVRGLFGVDIIVSPQGCFLLEINLRFCASMELIDRTNRGRTDFRSCIDQHLCAHQDAAAPKPTPLNTTQPRQVRVGCKQVVFSPRGLLWGQRQQRQLKSLQVHFSRHATLHDLPSPGAVVQPGGPILTVVTIANSASSALRNAGCVSRACQQALHP